MLTPRSPRLLGADRPVIRVARVKCGSCGRAVGDLIAAAETLLEATPAELRWRGKPACTCPSLACKATDLGVVLARAQRLDRPTTFRLKTSHTRPMPQAWRDELARRQREQQPRELVFGRLRKLTRGWSGDDWYNWLETPGRMPPDEPERH